MWPNLEGEGLGDEEAMPAMPRWLNVNLPRINGAPHGGPGAPGSGRIPGGIGRIGDGLGGRHAVEVGSRIGDGLGGRHAVEVGGRIADRLGGRHAVEVAARDPRRAVETAAICTLIHHCHLSQYDPIWLRCC